MIKWGSAVTVVVALGYFILNYLQEVELILPDSTVALTNIPLLSAVLSPQATYVSMLAVDHSISIIHRNEQRLVKFWEPETCEEPPYLLSTSENMNTVVAAGKYNVCVLSVTSGEVLASWKIEGNSEDAQITAIKLNAIGNRIFIGLNEGSIIMVDINHNKRSFFQMHSSSVKHILLSNNDQVVTSAGFGGNVVQWRPSDGVSIWNIPQRFRITSLAIDEHHNRLFVSDALSSQMTFKLDNQQVISSLRYYQRNRYFRAARFVDEGKKLITSSSKFEFSLWDVSNGNEILTANISALNMGSTTFDFEVDSLGNVYTISSDGILNTFDRKYFTAIATQ